MNITMNQPASQPSQPASQPSQPFGNLSMPQPNAVLERSKTVEKIIAFPKSLLNKIDASCFFGARKSFCWRAVDFFKEIERRFFRGFALKGCIAKSIVVFERNALCWRSRPNLDEKCKKSRFSDFFPIKN